MAIIMEDDHTSMNELTDEELTGVDQTPLSIPVQNKCNIIPELVITHQNKCNVTTPELVITHQKKRGRKRRGQPSNWKRNVRVKKKKKMKLKVTNTAPAEGR